ncbi:MAG TPA: translation initiation factor IF-2 [Pelagibacteraceae bacterium]|nr:translation initiation factor IF-2 [Pelagibacteraceae bacterium]
MEEKKKKKLTLSVSSKTLHNVPNYVKSRQKTSVLIEKKAPRRWGEKKFQSRDNNFNKSKSTANFIPKKTRINRNVDIRKMAEERATNRFKNLKEDSLQPKKSSLGKDKGFTSKREQKLTLSKALDDEVLDGRERSLASVRRARLKEKKNQDSEKAKIETKKIVHEVNIPGKITIQELSNRMAMQASNIIKHLLGMGVVATINHTIDADTAEYLVKEFGNIPIREKKPDLNILKPKKKDYKNLKSRPPIVTVMGHVDHGKTSLLDALRNTNIVAQEHGGITQHIGAYRVKTEKGKSITFIDTPGHAAFTEMRARGSKVTDIVVLVVAADDGVKPQTIEAIKHAKAAKVPIIVAINKCDLPAADPQKIKNELLQYELIAEELSGDTLFAEVSAITKKNLDKLKENITLQSDLLDLKASFEGSATGVILESRIDKGKGSVSTVLIISGNLEKGNYFVSGNTWGKIRAMINDQGQNIDSALPSTPVEILGMNNSAFAGDDFIVVDSEEKAKKINEYRIKDLKSKQAPLISANKESAFDDTATPEELSIIIKSDVHGSSEALKNAIEKIKHPEVTPKIILSNIGVITETDVTLARASNAILIGFNVRPNKEAKKLAETHKITIKFFNIIYEVLDFINDSLSGLLKPDVKEQAVGSAEVQTIFTVSKVGKVAGSKVIEGEIVNNLNARLIRDGNVLYTGAINSIFREKNAAKQVTAGLECGITLKNFADFKEKDVIEVYKIIETERRI